MKLGTYFLSFLPSLFVAGVILYLSFASPSDIQSLPSFPISDKLVHFCMYLGLTVVFLFDLLRYRKKSRCSSRFLFLCLFYPILFGALVEVAQEKFFPPRSGEFLDFLANTFGAVSAWFLVLLFLFYKKRKKENDPA